MARIDAAALLPAERLRRRVAAGDQTRLHRGDRYAEVGDTFAVDGATFEVTAVEDRTLGDLTDEDARAEGAEDLDAYAERLRRVHENFEWDDDSDVVLHRFERVE